MRKKYLSALLFGALLVTSAGTFTSCKDYDDDINNLQEQITANADAIKALQEKIGDGKFVTNIVSEGNGLKITWNDNQSTVIENVVNGEDQKGDVVTIDPETGEIKINDKGTGFFASKGESEEEVKFPYVNEEGILVLIDEEGKEVVTGIRVSPVTAVVHEDGSADITIIGADGKSQTIKVPSAAYSITDLIVIDGKNKLVYAVYSYTKKVEPKDWNGPRTLPSENTNIVSNVTNPVIQINPTTISPIDNKITFSLVDSKNNYPSNVSLTAEDFTDLLTSRAANANGLYSLSLKEVNISGNDLASFNSQFTSKGDNKLYAVTAGSSVRSEYQVTVTNVQAEELETLSILDSNESSLSGAKDFNIDYASSKNATDPDAKINTNEWYYVTASEEAALYDMHLSVSKDDETLFGVEIEESAEGVYKFRTTKNPDNITKAGFKLTIQTISKTGAAETATIWLGQTKIINSGYSYQEIPYQLKSEVAGKNYFSIDLSEMKNFLGEQGSALWNTQVDGYDMSIYKANDMENAIVNDITSGITPVFTNKVENNSKTVDFNKATNIVFQIDNNKAGDNKGGKFSVNTHYVAVITFKDGNEVLNTINVPFIFSIPAINTLFAIDPGFVNEGVANCYMYEADNEKAVATGAATFDLMRVFSKKETTGYTVTLDNKTVVTGNKKSADLAYIGGTDTNVSGDVTTNTYVTLKGTLGKEEGYNQTLNLSISGAYANAWKYPKEETFDFKVRIMSPIERGNVVPAEGNVVRIPASKLDGYHFGNDVIIGYTYNSQVSYKVLPVWDETAGKSVWSRNDISAVTGESGNALYFTVENNGKPVDAKAPTTSGNTTVANDGYFVLKGSNVDHTVQTTIKIKVTDIWNRVLTAEVPVEITVE